MNHWGSDQGVAVLKQLSQLYMFLIWETIVLETVSRTETSGDETLVAAKDLELLRASTSASQDDLLGNKLCSLNDCRLLIAKLLLIVYM